GGAVFEELDVHFGEESVLRRGGESFHGFFRIDVGATSVGDRGREFEVGDLVWGGESAGGVEARCVIGGSEPGGGRGREAGTEGGRSRENGSGENRERTGACGCLSLCIHVRDATKRRRPCGKGAVNVIGRVGERVENQ